jgi:hypothetical protein
LIFELSYCDEGTEAQRRKLFLMCCCLCHSLLKAAAAIRQVDATIERACPVTAAAAARAISPGSGSSKVLSHLSVTSAD